MDRLVQCVPNFSEGRRPETVRALVDTIKAVPGVILLDEEMDHDHHRAVLTFVGSPEAVEEAAFQVARRAQDLIDLRTHQGGHPRVGATDVVPFVPLRNIEMPECVAMARRVGQRIGSELGIPVFLYEQAATQPDRTNLESIRRGGLDGLAHRIGTDPAWMPDFGPQKLHPTAGATVVGARPPLIAYNINLATSDLEVAKAIAKSVRFSSGGLPHVKAIGVELASRRLVQVSMNLTNYEVTGIHTAYEAVRREAEGRGVQIVGSEIIGLVPQGALLRVAEAALKLEHFDPTQVLETRIERTLAREPRPGNAPVQSGTLSNSVSEFLRAVGAGTPTPGGGSVAALAGSVAAALGLMVCRIEAMRNPETRQDLVQYGDRLAKLSGQLQQLIQADAEAYETVLQAYRLPKTDPGRADAISSSLQLATEVPLRTATLAVEAARELRELLPRIKPTMASDLKVGLLMALAAIEGGLENVGINLKSVTNQDVLKDVLPRIERLKQSLVELRTL
jgi:glutamate formiminotransferase/glutamate formiminotransferase/formiminotetrahydrofolate cyclodeaminase